VKGVRAEEGYPGITRRRTDVLQPKASGSKPRIIFEISSRNYGNAKKAARGLSDDPCVALGGNTVGR
jgi:hypothetical protein